MKLGANPTVRMHVNEAVDPTATPQTPSAESKVAPGPSSAVAAAAPMGRAAQTSSGAGNDLRLVQEVVKALRKSAQPLRKVFYGEVHDAVGNLNLIGRILEGAVAADSGKVHLYKESNFLPGNRDEAEIDARGENVGAKAEVLQNFVKHHAEPTVPVTQQDMTRIFTAGLRPEVFFRLMNWVNPSRRDMTRFIEDRTFAIAWTGLAHPLNALYPDARGNSATEPWLGGYVLNAKPRIVRNLSLLPGALQQPQVTRDAQKDMFDGFARAQQVAPTMFVMSSSVWADPEVGGTEAHPDARVLGPQEKRARFIQYYNSKGFAVLEVPFATGQNAMMVVPAQYLAQLREIAARHPDQVKLFSHGLPGSDAGPAPVHGDLDP